MFCKNVNNMKRLGFYFIDAICFVDLEITLRCRSYFVGRVSISFNNAQFYIFLVLGRFPPIQQLLYHILYFINVQSGCGVAFSRGVCAILFCYHLNRKVSLRNSYRLHAARSVTTSTVWFPYETE